MANYSAQKLKSVSLNDGVRRYSDTGSSVNTDASTNTSPDIDETNEAVVSNPLFNTGANQESSMSNPMSSKLPSSTQSNPKQNNSTQSVGQPPKSRITGTRPLISPRSEGGGKRQSSSKDAANSVTSFDWDGVFSRTFLSVYMNEQDPLVGPGKFDYAFQIGEHRLYVLVQQESLTVDTIKVPKNVIDDLKQSAATNINKRFQQLSQKLDLPLINEQGVEENIHFLGLTSLMMIHNQEGFPVKQDYGSIFFQEECVLDLDDENKVLQLFSINSFFEIVKLLQTPSDMLCFFDHHLVKLVDYQEFLGEIDLAKAFIGSAEFFQRAVDVQQQLVEIGLLSKVETRLTNIVDQDPKLPLDKDQQLKKADLLSKLEGYSSTFQKLLNGVTKRRHEMEDTIPIEQVKILVAESMYTRMSIMEEMMAYEDRSREDCMQGYLCHQHSYNDFGNHYVIVVYGLADDAEYSREYIKQNHSSLLMDINAQLQDPAMQEYFILGFDMSNHDGKGNVKVEMDVYHLPGSQMSDIELHYYEQAQSVNN